ncbi:platelet-activating factor receptor-like [Arapaima gigas]
MNNSRGLSTTLPPHPVCNQVSSGTPCLRERSTIICYPAVRPPSVRSSRHLFFSHCFLQGAGTAEIRGPDSIREEDANPRRTEAATLSAHQFKMLQSNSSLPPLVSSTYPNSTHCDVSNWTASVLMPTVYSLVFCLGGPGNALALLVLCRNGTRLKAAMKVYLVNLTVSDGLFCLTLPLWVPYYTLHGHWPFLEVPCRLAGSLYYISMYSSISFMTLISVNRYRTLTVSQRVLPMLQRRGATYISTLTWLTWLSCAVPSIITPQIRLESGHARCFLDVEPGLALAACGFFAVSLLTVFFCYVSILASLGVQPLRQGLHRHRAKAMVLGMLLVFLVCVLPYHVTLAMWALQQTQPPCPSPAHHITTALLSTSSAVNPLIYCFSLPQFRSALCTFPLLRGAAGQRLLPTSVGPQPPVTHKPDWNLRTIL